ncbi:MAG: hypothetical protein IJM15_05870 [Erysipelotrichaceae bacterium]|nr:hypothetical protein [Erysipelotrichaceae bacterium]
MIKLYCCIFQEEKPTEKLKDSLIIAAIIIFALGLYVMMPKIFVFFAKYGKGVNGLALYLGISLIVAVAYWVMGYRGKSMLYIIGLILGISLMIWLYQNYRDIDTLISSRYGQLAATCFFFLIIILVWLFTKFFL